MALDKLASKNGSITVAGCGGDFNSFDLEKRQQVDDASGYAEASDADHRGAGLYAWTLDFGAVAQKGASGKSPGLGAMIDTAAAVVCTYDTGCTHSFNAVIESLKLSHRRNSGIVPFSGRAYNQGTVTEAWVVS